MSFSHPHVLTTRLCAAFALALGAMVLMGWALGIASIVQISPDWTPMVVNTAVGFVLSGIGLLAAIQRGRWSGRLAGVLGVLISMLAAEELCVLIFDIAPALSLPELHRPLQPTYPHPGRMAPNTALCFLLFGIGLVGLIRFRNQSIATWVERAAIAVLSIGLLGVVGYSLQLEYLYSWSGVVRMAVHTGVGMVVLGTGLWNLVRARVVMPPISEGKEVAGVYRAATLLLLLIAASAGIGGFALLQAQTKQEVQDDLSHMSADRIILFDQIIRDRSERAKIESDDNDLARLLRALVQAPQDPAMLEALHDWAGPLRANGFSSIRVEAAGRRWQLDGDAVNPALTARLHGDAPGWLLWRNGYVLRRALPVHDDAGVAGTLLTEQPMPELDAMVAATNRLGESGEMVVCDADAITLHCFPLRNRPQPWDAPRIVAGQPLPMDYAVRGKTGIITSLDYRQHRVLAAYGPIGKTGLGLVVKRDVAEIYAPIRLQFERIMLFLCALLLFGLWVMRLRLRPLLQGLEASRAQARTSSARFEAAVESNLDAFYILECMRDERGDIHDLRYVMLNVPGEEITGRPRADVLGHGMCELVPALRGNGMLSNCVRVVETGKPIIEERSSIVHPGRWYHMQIVKLGDGVCLTMRDITSARRAADRIRHQAMHDPLTGLTNRAGFELALAAAIAEAQQHGHVAAVAVLDLDEFKPINDSLGHAAGDKVLREVAVRLRDCMRPSDIVARLGGDEFVLVLPDIAYPGGADVVASKVLAQIARPMQVDGHAIAVTASIGISACPNDGVNAAHLLKCADAAMYRAKRAGRNGYKFCNPDVDLIAAD